MSHTLIKKQWHMSILPSLCMITITFESFLLGWMVLACHNGRRHFYSVFQPSKRQWFMFRETVMRKNGPCIVSTEVSLMSQWDPCCTVYLFFSLFAMHYGAFIFHYFVVMTNQILTWGCYIRIFMSKAQPGWKHCADRLYLVKVLPSDLCSTADVWALCLWWKLIVPDVTFCKPYAYYIMSSFPQNNHHKKLTMILSDFWVSELYCFAMTLKAKCHPPSSVLLAPLPSVLISV